MAAFLAIMTNLLLLGSKDDIKIVDNGRISNFVHSDITSSFPPIQSQYYEMKLQVKSKQMVRYLYFLFLSFDFLGLSYLFS